jgi:hypothetical protein
VTFMHSYPVRRFHPATYLLNLHPSKAIPARHRRLPRACRGHRGRVTARACYHGGPQLLPPRELPPLRPTRSLPSPPFRHVSPPPRPRPRRRELSRPPSSSNSPTSSGSLHHVDLVLVPLQHRRRRHHQRQRGTRAGGPRNWRVQGFLCWLPPRLG